MSHIVKGKPKGNALLTKSGYKGKPPKDTKDTAKAGKRPSMKKC